MDIVNFLEPVSVEKPDYIIDSEQLFSRNISVYTEADIFPSLENVQVAVIGVPEDRNSYNNGCSLGPDKIRDALYQLYTHQSKLNIVDLGNIKTGTAFTDTYAAVKWVLAKLYEKNITVVLIGGSQDLTIPVYEACEQQLNKINLSVIDPRIDADTENPDKAKSNTFLNKLIYTGKQTLHNFNLLAYQEYYTDAHQIREIKDLYYESYRLGIIRENFSEAEPMLRDAHIISLDASCIKQSEMPAHFHPSPNGFYGEEICRIARYAGLGDGIKCFGLYETNPRFDVNNQAANLCAQIIWYFLDGLSLRIIEYPEDDTGDFKKFTVKTEEIGHDIEFIKSRVTNRWWMKIPIINPKHHEYAACTVNEYNRACNNEIPEKWLNAYRRLN